MMWVCPYIHSSCTIISLYSNATCTKLLCMPVCELVSCIFLQSTIAYLLTANCTFFLIISDPLQNVYSSTSFYNTFVVYIAAFLEIQKSRIRQTSACICRPPGILTLVENALKC